MGAGCSAAPEPGGPYRRSSSLKGPAGDPEPGSTAAPPLRGAAAAAPPDAQPPALPLWVAAVLEDDAAAAAARRSSITTVDDATAAAAAEAAALAANEAALSYLMLTVAERSRRASGSYSAEAVEPSGLSLAVSNAARRLRAVVICAVTHEVDSDSDSGDGETARACPTPTQRSVRLWLLGLPRGPGPTPLATPSPGSALGFLTPDGEGEVLAAERARRAAAASSGDAVRGASVSSLPMLLPDPSCSGQPASAGGSPWTPFAFGASALPVGGGSPRSVASVSPGTSSLGASGGTAATPPPPPVALVFSPLAATAAVAGGEENCTPKNTAPPATHSGLPTKNSIVGSMSDGANNDCTLSSVSFQKETSERWAPTAAEAWRAH